MEVRVYGGRWRRRAQSAGRINRSETPAARLRFVGARSIVRQQDDTGDSFLFARAV